MERQITKEQIEDTQYGRYLLSDENIYLSIYSLNSYIFEYNLLSTEDRVRYHCLQDKFDGAYIDKTIRKVKKRIIELLTEDKYIEARVYFKPKKLSKDGKVEFRPLHTTDLITQIAIVSMLHLVVYEIPSKDEKNLKLELSNLSRLIPSDFYGNRVSIQPEYLFKPWKQQYQKYNQNSNDALKKYHTSLEYKYEVTLDLKNFFPTINPIIVYYYIIGHLPAHLADKEMSLMKVVLQKLLFCRLSSDFDEKESELKKQYYKVSEPEHLESYEDENVSKKTDNDQEQKEEKCSDNEKQSDSCKFVRGIPQGLPQSYFFGNIYMIPVSEIFRKQFNGACYFYVDDSVLFTNDVEEKEFEKQLKNINKQMKAAADKILENHRQDNCKIYPDETEEFYEGNLYGVEVHLSEKSNYARLDSLDESEVYLKCISREMSQAGSDFFRMYSDEENRNLEEKFAVLAAQVKTKRDQLSEQEEKQGEEKSKNDTKKFKERLTRYYRFFEYRRQKLAAMHQPENGSDEDYKEKLKTIIYAEFSEEEKKALNQISDKNQRNEEENKKILQKFINSYTADIWDAAVGMYQAFADDKELKELREYVSRINRLCYGKDVADSSYLKHTYKELLKTTKKTSYNEIFGQYISEVNITEEYLRVQYDDPYKTLKYLAKIRLKYYANKHYEVTEYYSSSFLKKTEDDILEILLTENNGLLDKMKIVRANTQKVFRMVLNTFYSYLFNVEISDSPVLAKNSKKALTYGELRILSFLRNPRFIVDEFRKREISLDDRQNKDTVDYSIMKVLEIFSSFVKEPVSIDKLIITHKYTCDVWKNGSKHLYFYTLHNQEHAIILIQNIVKLVHTIDFLKISAIDYYILFLACYLHDISMVKIPAFDSFLIDTDKADKLAKELLDEFNEEFMQENSGQAQSSSEEDFDILSVKKYMLNSYKKLDGYFESSVRGKHATDSAGEIRQRAEVRYLDVPLRELVAEISEAHCADERNIYGAKSKASNQLVSIKFDKILLRLADLLDMSSYRVSKPILHHNMEQMSEESAFHWISHLLTQGYKLYTKYEINGLDDKNTHSNGNSRNNKGGLENLKGVLTPKTITEKLILEIPVDISQMSAFECEKPCQKVRIDRNHISRQEIILICGDKCEDENDSNMERRCNFLCQWFCVKNDYLIRELAALKEYLIHNPNNYFKCEIEIRIKCNEKTGIDARQFEVLKNYIQKKNRKEES